MGVDGAVFSSGGKQSQHYIPGAYSRIDFVQSGSGTVATNNAVIMGDSRGGKPNTILWFASKSEAEQALVSGALLDAVKHAFSPGDGYAPQRIAAWRVNPGLRASRDFVSGETTMFTAHAWDYGLYGNQVKAKIEAGTTSGKKVSIKYQQNDEVVVDDVYRESFTIQYTGDGTTATMDITPTALTTTVDESGDLDIDLTAFPTIQDLVNYINDQADYSCAVVTGDPSQLTAELDSVTTGNIATEYTATSTLQAIIETVEGLPWVSEVEVPTLSARSLPDNDSDWAYFSGGTDGEYTSSEWEDSLDILANENVQFIGSSSTDSAVHSLIKTHCESMNGVSGKSERQFIVGGAAGETVAQAVTRAQTLASDAGALCYPGFTYYDLADSSKTKTYAPAYYAAKEIGRQVALALNEPATNKGVDVLGWESVLSTTEIEQLIKAGVWVGMQTKNGRFVNARAITTYQGATLQRNEFSMMREALFAARDLRTAIERTFIGRPGTNGRLLEVDAIVNAKLAYYADNLQIFVGNPPYWGYQKQVVGDQVRIDYDANLTAPINFAFITSHFHVYASTE
jgi:hypothetical protein